MTAEPFVAEPQCAVCGQAATRAELKRDHAGWHFSYSGITSGNGTGDAVDDERAALLTEAFTQPFNFDLMRTAGLYDNAGYCEECGVAYCYTHWRTSTSGFGQCPQGHGKSLDPHWSPD